jgi:NAD(P)-dependent dehydrogenase (short-subunit alcohol dehydrogenase family)
MNPITRRGIVIGSTATLAGVAAASITRPDQANSQQPQAKDSNQGTKTGRLAGQVAFVTGAARGIGRACAVALAKEGANVAIVDIAANIASVEYSLATEKDLAETKRLVEAQGQRALALKGDVRNLQQMREAVARTIKELGKIDIAVPNAGILTMGNLADMSEAAWDDVIAVNLSGVARTMMAVLPHMRDRKYGRIIAVVSTNGRFGSPGSPSYNASKWGALGLVKCVATEVAKEGITVNCVNPTGVRTAMTQQPKYRNQFEKFLRGFNAQDRGFIEPDEVAAALLFFALPEAAVITGEAMDVAAGANTRWNS